MPAHSVLFFFTAALLLGVVAGMRTFIAPAVLAIVLSRRPELVPAMSPAQWFTHPIVAILLGVGALGELAGDKLPKTPNRTALAPFAARVISGAISGAAIVQLGALNLWIGAACGAIGAAGSTLGMFHARIAAGRATGIMDRYIGAVEDVLAIAIAASVLALTVG